MYERYTCLTYHIPYTILKRAHIKTLIIIFIA
jgi:hypothetical protein